MDFLQLLPTLIFLTLIYYCGQLFFAIKTGMNHPHYFLGFNPKLVDIKFSGKKISIGLFIPLFPFARIYKIEEGKKERINWPWEFTNFPIWKRLLLTFAGVFSLLIASIIIFTGVAYMDVENYISKEELNKHGIYPSELARKAGFERGDKIIQVNGQEFDNYIELLHPETGKIYQISRAGKTIDLTISPEIHNEFLADQKGLFLYLDAPFEVMEILPSSPAEEAGLRAGDKIVNLNGKPVKKILEFNEELSKDTIGEVLLTVERLEGKEKKTVSLKSKLNEYKKVGFLVKELIDYSTKERSLAEAIGIGLTKPAEIIYSTIPATYTIRSGELQASASPTIGKAYDQGFLGKKFAKLTATFAALIVMLNFFPLPRTCFWEIIPLAYEGISKKNFTYKHFKILTIISYVLLGTLFILSMISDILRHWT